MLGDWKLLLENMKKEMTNRGIGKDLERVGIPLAIVILLCIVFSESLKNSLEMIISTIEKKSHFLSRSCGNISNGHYYIWNNHVIS